MYESILIPFDGSDEARRGAEHGIELAAALGASVHALYVIDLPGVPRTVHIRDDEERVRAQYRRFGEQVTGDLCATADESGVDCVTALKTGSPAEEIVEYADEEDLDAIVIGSAYRGTFRGLMGDTADKVVRTATVPVISLRKGVDD